MSGSWKNKEQQFVERVKKKIAIDEQIAIDKVNIIEVFHSMHTPFNFELTCITLS